MNDFNAAERHIRRPIGDVKARFRGVINPASDFEELPQACLAIVALLEMVCVNGCGEIVPVLFRNSVAPLLGICGLKDHAHSVFKLPTGHLKRVSFDFRILRKADAFDTRPKGRKQRQELG